MRRITMVVLSEEERRTMEGASWACYTPDADRKVGATLVRLLTEGVILPEDPFALAVFIAKETGVGEVTDTEATEVLVGRLRDIQEGTFPHMRQVRN